jgi:hypothetical protein
LTVTLPPAASSAGATVIVKKTTSDANVVTMGGAGADLIDGAATQPLGGTGQEAVTLLCDGTGWHQISRFTP